MADAYAWADLVVCRSGALTIAELCAAGVGALLVPFVHAVDDHQTRNAEFMVAGGAAELIPEASLNPRLLYLRLHSSLSSRKRLQDLARNARFLARTGAAERAAQICRTYPDDRPPTIHVAGPKHPDRRARLGRTSFGHRRGGQDCSGSQCAANDWGIGLALAALFQQASNIRV